MPCELVICPGRQIAARSHVPSLDTLAFTDPTAHRPFTSGPCTGSRGSLQQLTKCRSRRCGWWPLSDEVLLDLQPRALSSPWCK